MGDQFAAHVGSYGGLVDADLIPPSADDGTVGAGDGRHAITGATRSLELEFIREHGTVESVLIFHGEIVNDILSVDAGPFTAGFADTAFRCSQIGTGTAQVHFEFMSQFIEYRFKLIGRGTQQNDVTG